MKDKLYKLLAVLLLLSLVGCAGSAATSTVPPTDQGRTPGNMAQSEAPRVTDPDVTPDELEQLAVGNNTFALDLYQAVRGVQGNLFYSPYSISVALAMIYAGARGETEEQMAETLHYTLPQTRLHPAFNALDRELARRAKDSGSESEEGAEFHLEIANAVWAQQGYTFLPEYLDLLARNYGAGIRLLDFEAPSQARQTINQWVSEQTAGKIEELLPEGAIDRLTRLVLTNAIYFKAAWEHPFEEVQTQDAPFYFLDGGDTSVSMMRQTEALMYVEDQGYQALELPYAGDDLSMLILLPANGTFESFERDLTAAQIDGIAQRLERRNVALALPKFEFDARLQLSNALTQMGMPDAFAPQAANFTGMDGTRDLYIQDVLHKAYVAVDEAGTEAAAATGVVIGITSAPLDPVQVTVDHPFIFLIRDKETGAILFIGRVVNPSA